TCLCSCSAPRPQRASIEHKGDEGRQLSTETSLLLIEAAEHWHDSAQPGMSRPREWRPRRFVARTAISPLRRLFTQAGRLTWKRRPRRLFASNDGIKIGSSSGG